MKEIIPPVSRDKIIAELTPDKFVRKTNFGNNEIYIITAHDSPNVMLEVGRLREISFRSAGGGTGKEVDIDEFDTMKNPYKQLIVWNPEDKEIVGGYRYFHLRDAELDENGRFKIATAHMFKFSEKFIKEYFPVTIELGRSFVQPMYQYSADARKGLFSLDNLWDGLGALIVDNPEVKYFFGKVTLYLNFDKESRDIILYFMMKFFPDNEQLVTPYKPNLITTKTQEELEQLFTEKTFDENYKKLLKLVRFRNEHIPPLINAYMNLSPSMKTFGAALNPDFGEVEEIGILIKISDIYPSKKDRHLISYINESKQQNEK